MRGAPPPTPPGYELLAPIGDGTRSVVWKAVQVATGRWVALKVLDADAALPDTALLLDRERRTMAVLAAHPGVVTVDDVGVHEGHPWLAMELCRRGSLAAHVARHGALDVGSALVVLARLADALAATHDAGVVHGAVRPGNVLLTDHGEPALGDVGLDAVTAVGEVGLDHSAPELLAGAPPSPRTDVYALGITVWELLAGREEYAPEVPPPVLDLLRAMTTTSPEARVATMSEVAHRTRSVAAGLRVSLVDGLRLPPLPALDLVTDLDELDLDLGTGNGTGTGRVRAVPADGPAARRRSLLAAALAAAIAVLVGAGSTTIVQTNRAAAASPRLGSVADTAEAATGPGAPTTPPPPTTTTAGTTVATTTRTATPTRVRSTRVPVAQNPSPTRRTSTASRSTKPAASNRRTGANKRSSRDD